MMDRKKILILAILAAFLVPLSGSIYMPNIPSIENEFGSSWLIPLTVTGYLASQAVFQLIYGPLSDKLGRRKVYLPAMVAFVFSNIMCYLAWDPSSLVIFRIFQGGAVASGFTIGAAVISDVFPKDKRGSAMGTFMAVPLIAPPVASFIGGLLGEIFIWRTIFLFLGVMGTLIAVIFFLYFPETRDSKKTEIVSLYSSMKFLTKGNYLTVTLLGMVLFGTMYTYLVFFGDILADKYQFNTFWVGIAFTLYGLTNSVAAFTGGRLADKFSRKKVFVSGGIIATMGTLFFSLMMGGTVYVLIVGHLIFGIGIGFANPSLVTYAVEFAPKSTGSASGTYNFIRALGAAVVTFLGYFVIDAYSNSMLFIFCSIAILVVTITAIKST